ncbi:recombination protein RecR [Candidatus Kaiserbacteria bacterium]|nr:recombination protein RecR [Candidatus Kaiserbacteria bacterium]
MDPIERLGSMFERFPGIGPRQAGRFVQFLLRSSPSYRRELVDALQQLGGSVTQCTRCMRFHTGRGGICGICGNTQRDARFLAIVASDVDVSALERSGTYRGYYFVLGGTISLASEKTSNLRLSELLLHIGDTAYPYTEAILAFPANPEGDATATRVREELADIAAARDIKVTALGRGLSTGSELEYADPDTIQSAFESRR